MLTLRLPFREPFDREGLLGFLGPRAVRGVETVEGMRYLRTFHLEGVTARYEADFSAPGPWLRLRLPVSACRVLSTVVERVRGQFDLGADPEAISGVLIRDPALASRVRARPGLRIPGAWDRFELAVRAVVGQQVSVSAATTVAGRIVTALGEALPGGESSGHELLGSKASGYGSRESESEDIADEGCGAGPEAKSGPRMPDRLFPTPEALAEAPIERFGMPGKRAEAVRRLSAAVRDGELDLDAPRPPEVVEADLVRLPGIGPWTARYIAMRALKEPDAFPEGDLGIRKALGTGGNPVTPAEAKARAEAWRPWRAYGAIHLWLGTGSGDMPAKG